RVSRKRIGHDCVRWAVDRGGGRKTVQSNEVCHKISCHSDSLLLERSGINAGGYGSHCRPAESLCPTGYETFLGDADAIVRARADESACEVHENTRGVGCGV